MKFPKQRFFVSALSIATATFLLLAILSISTIRNLNRERDLVEQLLQTQGKVVIEGLQAGTRAHMMGMGWSGIRTQSLIEEVAKESHLTFIALVDREGVIRFHSDEKLVGKPFPHWDRVASQFEAQNATAYYPDENTLAVYKRFSPLKSGFPGSGRGMGMMGFQAESPPMMILVGLDLTSYNQARREDIWHALFMGVVLFLVGCGAFLVIFFIQNTYLIHRAFEQVQAFHALILRSMPNSLIALDGADRVVTINPSTETLFGYDLRAFHNSGLELIFHERAEHLLEELKEKGRILGDEESAANRDGGMVPVSVFGSLVTGPDDSPMGTVLLIQDLREIKELRERTARSERLAAVGSLAAGVAHEIRNPLSSIRGFAQLFMKKFSPEAREYEYARVMVTEVERLNRVISALLDFARPKKPVIRSVDVKELLDHALQVVRDDLGRKQIKVENRCENGTIVRADPDQLIQVLLNLYLNAVDAMDTGGLLRVEAEANDDTVEIRIADNGQGMDPETLKQIFNPFFTTKDRGMGLGLAVAHRIMEDHGGSLSAWSSPGRGSTFFIRLPVSRE
ncbi:MAG: PAS domain S-box protein [Deltaproteobacteria bacterium]|nr:PAS domain S-box protein [Deltaproteobacteria bacterium]